MEIQSDSTKVTFTQVYTDAKEAIQGLAEALKVGAEHVYEVLVRQQMVESITWSCIILALTAFTFYFGHKAFGRDEEEMSELENAMGLTTLIGGIITILVFLFNINSIITGFVNPEYGAMKEIMEFVK